VDVHEALRRCRGVRQPVAVDPFLGLDVGLCFELQVPLVGLGVVVLLEGSLDVDRMGVMPLDQIFALAYSLRLRSCRLMGAFVISPLPPLLSETLRTAGSLGSTGVTPLPGYCEPHRHPLVFDRLPGVSGYTAYLATADFAAGRGGLLQLRDTSSVTVLSLLTPPE